jgi:hypothetical protein
MPEHVRVGLEAKLGHDAQPRHHLAPPFSIGLDADIFRDVASARLQGRLALAGAPLAKLGRPELGRHTAVGGLSVARDAARARLATSEGTTIPALNQPLSNVLRSASSDRHHRATRGSVSKRRRKVSSSWSSAWLIAVMLGVSYVYIETL